MLRVGARQGPVRAKGRCAPGSAAPMLPRVFWS